VVTARRPGRRARLAIGLLIGAGLAAADHAQTLREPVGRVNDFANLLDEPSTAELDTLLETLENDTTAQIAVATVPSLDGLTVEEYATRLFNTWGVGQKDKDNGVLVLVAPSERAMRIEVGYGLEKILPDGLAVAIVREDFLPPFRDGDYQTGILRGVRRVAGIVRRNEPITDAEMQALEQLQARTIPLWGLLALLGAFVAIGAYILGVGLGARLGVWLILGMLIVAGGAAGLWFAADPRAIWAAPPALLLLVLGLRRTRSEIFVNRLRGGRSSRG
jgi:uncharacterized protein